MYSLEEGSTQREKIIYTYITYFFSISGLIIYIISLIGLKIYLKTLIYIKSKIFHYILLNSLTHLIEIILLSPSKLCQLFLYVSQIIQFILIISFINDCLLDKQVSNNMVDFSILYLKIFYIAFSLVTFPYLRFFSISKNFLTVQTILTILFLVGLFKLTDKKLKEIMNYLKQKQMTGHNIPDLYLPYMKAYQLYVIYSVIKKIFFMNFIVLIISNILQILINFLGKNNMEFLFYLGLIINKSSFFICCFGFIYVLYLINADNIRKKQGYKIPGDEGREDESGNKNFSVIDIDIIQDNENENDNDNEGINIDNGGSSKKNIKGNEKKKSKKIKKKEEERLKEDNEIENDNDIDKN